MFGLESLIAPLAGGLVNTLFSDDEAPYNQPNLTKTQSPWGPSIPAAQSVLDDASGIYGQGGFSPIANQLELLGRSNALGYAENTLPGLIGSAQGSWMQGLNPGLDPYVGAMIESAQNDLVQDYARNVLPRISSQSQAVGGYGGSRQGVAQGIASEGLLESMGDVETRLLSDAYGKSLAQQQAAWNAAPMMTGLGFVPAEYQQQVGGQYRGDAMQPAQNLMGFQGATLPYFQAGFGTSTAPNPGYQPMANQFLSGAATGQQLYQDVFGNQTPMTANNVGNYNTGGQTFTPDQFRDWM